jgi:hypothetical protein
MSVLFERDTAIGRMGAPTVFTIGNSTGNFADAIEYKAGTVVYGAITAITPDAAGVVILYKE